ncbi:MAG: hypothetical protein R3E86_18680 [Pseudomonadales bacterium]
MTALPTLRRSLPALLLVLCQGLLVLHDSQHVVPEFSHCAVCQAHAPQIAEPPPHDLVPLPVFVVRALLPLEQLAANAAQPRLAFRSRAPPKSLS